MYVYVCLHMWACTCNMFALKCVCCMNAFVVCVLSASVCASLENRKIFWWLMLATCSSAHSDFSPWDRIRVKDGERGRENYRYGGIEARCHAARKIVLSFKSFKVVCVWHMALMFGNNDFFLLLKVIYVIISYKNFK